MVSRATLKSYKRLVIAACLSVKAFSNLSVRASIQKKMQRLYAQFNAHWVNILKTFRNKYYIILWELLYGFGMDLLKLLHGFVKDVTCIFCPLPNKTKQKYDLDLKLIDLINRVKERNKKYSITWVRCLNTCIWNWNTRNVKSRKSLNKTSGFPSFLNWNIFRPCFWMSQMRWTNYINFRCFNFIQVHKSDITFAS